MAIPDAQLDTWSHQGSITQSSNTYAAIRNALDDTESDYYSRTYRIFLQGSYGNDTNIYAESDVDVVIQLVNSTFYYELTHLSLTEANAFRSAYPEGTYSHADFKRDVLANLRKHFSTAVESGAKALKIRAESGRRSADVIVALEFRRYHRFGSLSDAQFVPGICFFASDGTRIANYPKQHSENCTRKHQETGQWFKPLVRIVKNMRSRLVDDGVLSGGDAPSYYIEGLLYNVPTESFGESYEDTFVKSYNWIVNADRSKFLCANRQYPLLDGDSNVTWSSAKCDAFLEALKGLWTGW